MATSRDSKISLATRAGRHSNEAVRSAMARDGPEGSVKVAPPCEPSQGWGFFHAPAGRAIGRANGSNIESPRCVDRNKGPISPDRARTGMHFAGRCPGRPGGRPGTGDALPGSRRKERGDEHRLTADAVRQGD